MKESAQAALSLRAHATPRSTASRKDFLEKSDLHIHIPAGGMPKDGPSAGVTMFTALVSMLTGHSRSSRRRDDRRDHAARPRAAHRRPQGEGARGAPRGHQARHHPRAQQAPTSTRCRRRSSTSSSSSRAASMDQVLEAALESMPAPRVAEPAGSPPAAPAGGKESPATTN